MPGSFIENIQPNQRHWIDVQGYAYQANLDSDLIRDDQPGASFDYAASDGSLLGQLDFSRSDGMGQDDSGPAVIPPPVNSALVSVPGLATPLTQTQALIGAGLLGLAACKLGLIPTAVGAGVVWFLAKQSGR